MHADTQLGGYLKKLIKDFNTTQQGFAEKVGVSRQTINGLISGKTQLSDVMALKLSNLTGDRPDFWFTLQEEGWGGEYTNSQTPQIAKNRSHIMQRWQAKGQHTLVDKEIIEAKTVGILGISHFTDRNVQPASYDLSMGNAIVSVDGKRDPTDIREDPINLKPNSTAVIQTLEKLNFPIFFLGRLGNMTKLASRGILVIHGHQVDPGFRGHIYVTLKNLGNNTFSIVYGKPFLSLEVVYLSVHPKEPYRGINLDREFFSENELLTVNQ